MVPGIEPLRPQTALLAAESFSVDVWQRVHLHNLVDGFAVRRLPARQRLCGCAKVWGLPPGDHQGRLLLIDPDGQALGSGPVNPLRAGPHTSSCTVLTAFTGVVFVKAGRHELCLEIDGRTVASIPLEVAVTRDADG